LSAFIFSGTEGDAVWIRPRRLRLILVGAVGLVALLPGTPSAAWPGGIGSTQGQSLKERDLYHEAARRLCTAQGVRGNAWYDCVTHYRQVVFCVLPPNLDDLTDWAACVQRAVADAEQREAERQRQAEEDAASRPRP
jgi:hypothetical protein